MGVLCQGHGTIGTGVRPKGRTFDVESNSPGACALVLQPETKPVVRRDRV